MKKALTLTFSLLILSTTLFSQTITIDTSKSYQVIDGFGGYTNKLKTGYDNFLLQIVDNMGLTILRQWVEVDGVSDTNQIKNGSFAFNEPTDYSNFYKAIKNKGVTKIIATCWSPPSCIKKNGSQCDQGCAPNCSPNSKPCYTDTNNVIVPDQNDLFAKYIAAWAKDFQTQSTFPLYALSIQNEPMYSGTYSSAYLYSSNYGPLLKAVHDTFKKEAALKNILFFGPEQMAGYNVNTGNGGNSKTRYIQDILENPAYDTLLDIYASHCYPVTSYIKGSETSFNQMSQSIIDTHKKRFWMSEVNFEESLDWDKVCIPMLQNMFVSLKNGRSSTWLYWTMNSNSGMWIPTSPLKRLYAVKHFFRFVRPGYKQIDCNVSDVDLGAMAFKKDNNITLVFANWNATYTKKISIPSFAGKPLKYKLYRSNVLSNCAYEGETSGDSITLKPHEVVTLYYNEQEKNYVWSPVAPSSITTSSISDNSITVNWTASPSWVLHGVKDSTVLPIKGYNVYLNGVKKTVNGSIKDLTYTFNSLQPGISYKIEVFAIDSIYNESAAATLTIVTSCSAGNCVSLSTETDDVSVFPQPAGNSMHLIRSKASDANLIIINSEGVTCLNRKIQYKEEIISTEELNDGIYFMIIKQKDLIVKKKLIVIH